MYRHVMVPLDGSAFAEAALPLALTISRKTGADVHLVMVLEPVSSFAFEGWESAATDWGREYFRGVVERLSGQSAGEVTTALLNGHTVERLQEEALARRADLVVMATHGRGALSRMWIGSVADGFVRHTDRPVLLVRPEEDAQAPTEFERGFSTLLVPLDGSEMAESALAHAVEFGELFAASYHLTRVVAYPFDIASPYLPATAQMNQAVVDDAKRGAAEYLEAQANVLRRRGLSVTTSVTVDPQAAHAVLSEAENVGADAIAMATHGRTGLGRAFLGSTADKVLRGTHAPVLLYRPVGVPADVTG